jgi:hypothetical protein
MRTSGAKLPLVFRQGVVPVIVAHGPPADKGVIRYQAQAGRFYLWVPERDDDPMQFAAGDGEQSDFLELLSELRAEPAQALGSFLYFFHQAGALNTFREALLARAKDLSMAATTGCSDLCCSIGMHVVDQCGEYHLVEGWYSTNDDRAASIEVVELASASPSPIRPIVIFKERRQFAAVSPGSHEETAQAGRVGFCVLWRAEPTDSERLWLLQLDLRSTEHRIALPLICTCERWTDRDVSRDVVKILFDDWRVDEPSAWKIAGVISGARANRFRNHLVRTEVFRFGPDRPAKRSIIVYLTRMTSLFSLNLYMSDFVASPGQGTELIILVIGRQAWFDLVERCLTKLEAVCQNPITVIYSPGSVPAAMALAGIMKSLKSDAVLLLPAEFSWPAFDPLFESLETSTEEVLLLRPVPDWRVPDTPLTQRSAVESFFFSKRALLGSLWRRPILADRHVLMSALGKLPIFIRDEMLFEELGRYLEDLGAGTLQAVGCFQVEAPVRLSRVETVVNHLIALQRRRSALS